MIDPHGNKLVSFHLSKGELEEYSELSIQFLHSHSH